MKIVETDEDAVRKGAAAFCLSIHSAASVLVLMV